MHHVMHNSNPLVTSLLRKGEEVSFTVISGSMKPVFFPGDKIGIRRTSYRCRFGDIVLFKDKGEFCVHRIIAKKGCRFHTKGDGTRTPDRPVKKESILGHAVWVEKSGILRIGHRLIGRRVRLSISGRFVRFINIIVGVLSLSEAVIWGFFSDVMMWKKGAE